MTPAVIDFTIYQGTTFGPWTLTITEEDGTTPIDLTGASIRMMGRKGGRSHGRNYPSKSAAPLFDITGVIDDGPDGLATLPALDAETTAELDFETGVHDIELTMDSGQVIRVWEGTVTLSREVTK